MTLDEMCQMAARLSDRYDEFEKTVNESNQEVYEDDALHYFNVFKDAINEAYFEISRKKLHPDTYESVVVSNDGTIDLTTLTYPVCTLIMLLNADKTKAVTYDFRTRFVLNVSGASPGDTVTVNYHYLPDRLDIYTDEPIFPESMVDPMLYVCLAVSRIWQSEKKFNNANSWLNEYYNHMNNIRSDMRNRTTRRIPRRMFR